jgi:hypothetical protein
MSAASDLINILSDLASGLIVRRITPADVDRSAEFEQAIFKDERVTVCMWILTAGENP